MTLMFASRKPGAAGITELTSSDASVTITDPEGPVVDLSVAGGGLPAWFQSGNGDPIDANPTTPNTSGGLYFDTSGESGLWVSPTGEDGDWLNFGAVLSEGPTLLIGANASGVRVTSAGGALISPGGFGFSLGASFFTVFCNAGNPNDVLAAYEIGDLCVDVTTPALWQATEADDIHWIQLGAPSVVGQTLSANAVTVASSTQSSNLTNDSAGPATITLDTTDATDFARMVLRFYDFSDVAQGLTFVNTEDSLVSVPTESNGSTTEPITVGFVFNVQTGLWRCVGVA
jgi:hypothetical protein